MTLLVFASARTHRAARHENQDAFGIAQDQLALACFVADGVGGESGGRLAGRLATRAATRAFKEMAGHPPRDRLRGAARAAQEAVRVGQRSSPECRTMASTLLGAATDGSWLWLSWLGDSPAYLVRGRHARPLTRPHLRADDGYPVLTRYLGAARFAPQERRVRLLPGDRIVLCSDGVSDVVEPDQLASVVGQQAADAAARAIVRSALRLQTTDNATAVVMVRTGMPAPPLPHRVIERLAALRRYVLHATL